MIVVMKEKTEDTKKKIFETIVFDLEHYLNLNKIENQKENLYIYIQSSIVNIVWEYYKVGSLLDRSKSAQSLKSPSICN